jgi:phage I-like protein
MAMQLTGYKQQGVKEGQRLGAQAERSRQQRLKSGTMNTGGKGGQSTVVLSAEQRRVAKMMGVSPESYAEAASLPGKQ